MGAQKAALDWHGSTLLARTVDVLAMATGGPVVVVRARGQALPELPDLASGVVIAEDPREGKGPLQGIAAGLAALAALAIGGVELGGGGLGEGGFGGDGFGGGGFEVAFVAATDMPFLHPAFVRRVLAILVSEGASQGVPCRADIALPVARGFPQPLAAAYRVGLAPVADALLAQGRLRPADLFASCAVTRIDEALLLADPALAEADPDLDSLINVNDPAEYAAALARSQSRPESGRD